MQPGVVMERLNARLRQHKLWFPVDVSTGDRATIGGMTANNSCGARSIRYGNMVHNVRAIDAILADGTEAHFGEVPGNFGEDVQPERYRNLVRDMRALHRREADEIDARIPKLLRQVGGYNIDMMSDEGHNMANLLVGSRRHPRLLHRDRTRPAADPAAPGARHLPFPELLQGDGRRPSTSSSWARRRSSWSTAR